MLVSRMRSFCAVAILSLSLGWQRCGAQGSGPVTPPAAPPTAPATSGTAPASADAFSGPIRKGDTVKVVVAGEDAMGGDFRVETDGTVSIPRLDSFAVAGKMQTVVAQLIGQRIEVRQLLKHAEVTVYITGRKIRTVVINGAITTQGSQTIKDNTVLSEVVESSTPLSGADLSRIVITRADGTMLTVNYKQFRNGASNTPDVNPPLQDDDHIYIYSAIPAEGSVRVVGEAKDPSKLIIPISAGMTVGQVLQIVGGVSEYADRGGIYINRAGQRIPVLYDDILRNSRGKDIVLQDKDEIEIPRLDKPRQITVDGAVKDAKALPLLSRLTILDAISQAGGPQDGAQQNKVELRRRNNTGALTTRVLDITKDSDASTDMIDGDIVFVPYERHRDHINAGTIIGILSGLAVLYSVLR